MDTEPVFTNFDNSLPDYINFLLSEEIAEHLDLQLNVGPDKLHQEKIGAVKWMLIARSKVFRVMLLQSKIKQLETYDVTDLEPKTFKQFLTYIYGHDHMDNLQFEDAVKLLSAAEKYEVRDLKSRLADTITPRVTVENVLAVLDNGPVCETVPPLWEETTRMIQTETKALLESPRFISLKPSAVVHILQQDELSVDEIEVWRASLRWARHQLSGVDGPVPADAMRSTMLPLLRHTRLCTLNYAQLCEDVFSTDIVTNEEFKMICSSVKNRLREANLTTISNEIDPRKPLERIVQISSETLSPHMVLRDNYFRLSHYVIKANKQVKLSALEFIPNNLNHRGNYNCEVTVRIGKVTHYDTLLPSAAAREFKLEKQVPFGQQLDMTLKDGQGGLELASDTCYSVLVRFKDNYSAWITKSITSQVLALNGDLTLIAVNHEIGAARNQLKGLKYTLK